MLMCRETSHSFPRHVEGKRGTMEYGLGVELIWRWIIPPRTTNGTLFFLSTQAPPKNILSLPLNRSPEKFLMNIFAATYVRKVNLAALLQMSGNSTSLRNSIQIWAEYGWQRPRGTGHDSAGCLRTEHSRDRAAPGGTGSGFQAVRPTSRECSAARDINAIKLWPCIFFIIFIDTSLLKGGHSILYGLGHPSASLLPVLRTLPIFLQPCLERKENCELFYEVGRVAGSARRYRYSPPGGGTVRRGPLPDAGTVLGMCVTFPGVLHHKNHKE